MLAKVVSAAIKRQKTHNSEILVHYFSMNTNTCKLIKEIQQKHLKIDLPNLKLGDTVNVGVLIQEGKKQRIQSYQSTYYECQ